MCQMKTVYIFTSCFPEVNPQFYKQHYKH